MKSKSLTVTYTGMSAEQISRRAYLDAVYARMQYRLFPGGKGLLPDTDYALFPGGKPHDKNEPISVSKVTTPEVLQYTKTDSETETVDFNQRSLMTLKKVLGGSLGISSVAQEVRDALGEYIDESKDSARLSEPPDDHHQKGNGRS